MGVECRCMGSTTEDWSRRVISVTVSSASVMPPSTGAMTTSSRPMAA